MANRRRKVVTKRSKPKGERKTSGLPLPTIPTNPWDITLPRPEMSTTYTFTTVSEFAPGSPQAAIPRPPEGSPGIYTVTFILSLPGQQMYRASISHDDLVQSGDSLLLIPGIKRIDLDFQPLDEQTPAAYVALPNQRGALATLSMQLQAANATDAQRVAFNHIMSFLSWWSYHEDVALEVAAWEAREEATQTTHLTVGLLGKERASRGVSQKPVTPILRRFLSSYREGLGATNGFYRVLCFYRVIEGVTKQRNARLGRHRAAGQEYRGPTEAIPPDDAEFPISDPIERKLFSPYFGRSFTYVRDKLRPTLRNAIAHLDPARDVLVADNFDDTAQCVQAIPVLKYIAREMLRHEIDTQAQEQVATPETSAAMPAPDQASAGPQMSDTQPQRERAQAETDEAGASPTPL